MRWGDCGEGGLHASDTGCGTGNENNFAFEGVGRDDPGAKNGHDRMLSRLHDQRDRVAEREVQGSDKAPRPFPERAIRDESLERWSAPDYTP
jgi:hypothetical protein